MKENIDAMDSKIISLLEQNGRMPNTELAKKLKTSETTIRKRIKRLIDNELIKIVAIRNRARLGYDLSGNIRITADTKKTRSIGSSLSKMDQIWYVAQLAGYDNFDVEFSVASQHDLLVLLDKINKIDGVISTRPSIRLQLMKHLGEFMAAFVDAKNIDIVKG
ncbi:MAG: AsnC family transcriptional regulator [Deltaproteobacteria bacterium]|nr:AsnC family transcriptional regulator [Deltaproteobacteria bacterium]MBW2634955.1 AsnC family transcriptional regulator [Deltaproteobacteria bacterium]